MRQALERKVNAFALGRLGEARGDFKEAASAADAPATAVEP
jgi:hypothetical protein